MAYKVFTNGSVLPASDVNTYLMDQSVMVFSSSATRAAALTAPVEGMLTWLEDVNRYEYRNGSGAWVALSAPGLTLISSTTFTAQTIVDVNNVFSATYDDYLVLASGVKLTNNGNVSMTFVNGSTPAAANFAFNHFGLTGSATAANGFNAGTDVVFADTTVNANNEFRFKAFITDVFKTEKTLTEASTYAFTNRLTRLFMGHLNNSVSFEGLRLQTATASITGSLKIYGLGK